MDEKNLSSKYPLIKFGWIDGLVLLGGMILGAVLLATISAAFLLTTGLNLEMNPWFLACMNIIPLTCAIVLFDFAIVRPKYKKPLNFNFSSTNFYTYLLIFPMMFGMMMISEYFTNFIPTTGPILGEMFERVNNVFTGLTNDWYLMFIMAVVAAPLLEEIIFRGIIQKGLINGGMDYRKAILVASFLFGVVHGNPWQFLGALLMGMVLGFTYHKTKTLLVPILLHAFNNGISFLLTYYDKDDSFADLFGFPDYIILLIGLVVFGVFYYLFTRKYKVHYSEL